MSETDTARWRQAIGRWLMIPDDRASAAARAVALIFSLALSVAIAKAGQSTLFLTRHGAGGLPWAFAASALSLAIASSLCVGLAPKLGAAKLAQRALLLCVLGLFIASAASMLPGGTYVAYVLVETISGVAMIQCWSLAALGTNARTARRVLPIAGAGGGIGWVVAAFVVPPLAAHLGAAALLSIAPILLSCAWLLARIIAKRDLPEGARRARSRESLGRSMVEGLRFLGATSLTRWLGGLAMLAMLLDALLDYGWMAAAHEAFPDEAELARHISTLFGVTSFIGLLFAFGGTSRLMSALGTSRALAFAPALALFAAACAAIVPGAVFAALARGTWRVLKRATWSTSMDQLQTPLPALRRAQTRTALRGVLGPAAYGITGLGLSAMPHDEGPSLAFGLSAAMALFAVVVALSRVRGAYLDALRRAVDTRRITLTTIPDMPRAPADPEGLRVIRTALVGPDLGRAQAAAELLGMSGDPRAVAPLARASLSATPDVREAAIVALSRLDGDEADAALIASLNAADHPALARAAAVAIFERDLRSQAALDAMRAMGATASASTAAANATDAADADTATAPPEDAVMDPHAARVAELHTLRATLDDEALGAALAAWMEGASGDADDGEARRLAALDIVTPAVLKVRTAYRAVAATLRDGPLEASIAAARAVLRAGETTLLPDVVQLLRVPAAAPQVAKLLATPGHAAATTGAGIDPARTHSSLSRVASRASKGDDPAASAALVGLLIDHADPTIRRPAVHALADAVERGARPPLPIDEVAPYLASRSREAQRAFGVASRLSTEGTEGVVRYEARLRASATREELLDLLRIAGRARLAGAALAALRDGSKERHAQAIELVDTDLPSSLDRHILPLFEAAMGDATSSSPGLPVGSALDVLRDGDDPLLRALAGCALDRRDDPEVLRLLPLFDRIHFLRSVPLFASLPGEDVVQLAERLETLSFSRGERIFSSGEQGDSLFVVVDGEVVLTREGRHLVTCGRTEFFGELAVLDRQPRSGDATASKDARLLRLASADLEELLAERPKAAREILRVLATRLRQSRPAGEDVE